MRRVLTLLYGVLCYGCFFAVFLYLVGFLANVVVPRSVDVGPAAPLGQALLVDAALILLFGLQHSVMARPAFKRAWTRIVPQPIERSTYVLATSLVLGLLYFAWQPIPTVVWSAESTLGIALGWTLFAAGWGIILLATFVIDHFDLFGLKQVVQYARGREHTEPRFQVRWFYRFVRHPLYVGWITAFWATPHMTVGHLVFAFGMTSYILAAIRVEERDLVALHGKLYTDYRERVPALVPRPGRTMRPVAPGSLSAPLAE